MEVNEENNDTETFDGEESESGDSGLEYDDDNSNNQNDNGDKYKMDTNKRIHTKRPTIQADIVEKYQKLKGKQLFVLFPKKLPQNKDEFEKKVKSLNKRITTAIKPRQKSCRYCLIQFDNEKDCRKSMVELKKMEVDGKNLVVKLPKTDNDEFIKEMAKNKAAKNLKYREKLKLKKLAIKEARKKSFTSTLIVSNIPSSATVADVKELFSDAVELRFTLAKGVENTSTATVSLPSPRDASNAYKKKLKIDRNNLKISFALPNTKDKNEKRKLEIKKHNGDMPSNKKPKIARDKNISKASSLKNNTRKTHDK